MKPDVMNAQPDIAAHGVGAIRPVLRREAAIRGYRIDLHRVETAVGECPGVTAAVTLATASEGGDPQLVCYVTPSTVDRTELRRRLQLLLPDYMVPSAFVAIEQLPRLADGEIDADALPAPDREESAAAFESPADAREAQIAQAWMSLLGVEQVGRGDDFFELGGNPAMVAQMVSLLRRAGLSTDIDTVFANPRLAELAAAMDGGGGGVESPIEAPTEIARGTPTEGEIGRAVESQGEQLTRLLAQSAVSSPEAIALCQGGTTITYRELDRRANRLAHELGARGVGRGDLVGLCLVRSPRMLVGVLAVL